MAASVQDSILEDFPEGRFLLAIADAAVLLDIEPLGRIVLDSLHPPFKAAEPELWIGPLTEQTLDSPLLGLHNAMLRARITIVESLDATRRQPLGFHIRARHLLLRRFGGMTTAGASVSRGDDCFKLGRAEFGPFFDETSRQQGFIRNEIIVQTEYSGP